MRNPASSEEGNDKCRKTARNTKRMRARSVGNGVPSLTATVLNQLTGQETSFSPPWIQP